MDSESVDKDTEKLERSYAAGGNVNVADTLESCSVVPQNIRYRISIDLEIFLLGM